MSAETSSTEAIAGVVRQSQNRDDDAACTPAARLGERRPSPLVYAWQAAGGAAQDAREKHGPASAEYVTAREKAVAALTALRREASGDVCLSGVCRFCGANILGGCTSCPACLDEFRAAPYGAASTEPVRYRVTRTSPSGGRKVYGPFAERGVAEMVAQRAAEKHMTSTVVVEPVRGAR